MNQLGSDIENIFLTRDKVSSTPKIKIDRWDDLCGKIFVAGCNWNVYPFLRV